jgi:hypothetical protein
MLTYYSTQGEKNPSALAVNLKTGFLIGIYLDAKEGQMAGRSKASIEALKSLNSAGLISYILIHKRIGGHFNFPAFNKKYLGIIKKINARIMRTLLFVIPAPQAKPTRESSLFFWIPVLPKQNWIADS